MSEISREQAKIIAPKVNELIRKSYADDAVFMLTDVMKLGLTKTQAIRLMNGFVKSKIFFVRDGLYSANPKPLYELKKEKAAKK